MLIALAGWLAWRRAGLPPVPFGLSS
ncbi:hypothetical protein [Cryptosporangium sp. NPDC051539]